MMAKILTCDRCGATPEKWGTGDCPGCGAGYIPPSSFPVVALSQIANLWSQQLQGTPQEKSPENLLAKLTAAIRKVEGAAESIRVTRDEILSLADEWGYPRPRFWDPKQRLVETGGEPTDQIRTNKRGPKPGTTGYGDNDKSLFQEMERMMREQGLRSLSEAARQLVRADRVSGAGPLDSKVKRLVANFNKTR
jgi:hypothetical protein